MAERVPAPEEPTIGKLVGDVSKDVSSLIRNEIALAKTELKVSARAGGRGAAMFGAAAFLLVLGVIMLSVAIAYFIHFTGLDLAWCFLIVFALHTLLAVVLALVGRRSLRKVGPPERSIVQLQETKAVLKRG